MNTVVVVILVIKGPSIKNLNMSGLCTMLGYLYLSSALFN